MKQEDILTSRIRIGRQIADKRRERGLSTYQLSVVSGVLQPHISNIENGKMSPTIDTLLKLANALEAKIVIE